MVASGDDAAVQSLLQKDLRLVPSATDFNGQIEELRHQLEGLLDQRDDAAAVLSGYNTRALSAIRGIFGPDSAEYDQAGGTRTGERKTPVRKPKDPAK